jgi:hypothetical protein
MITPQDFLMVNAAETQQKIKETTIVLLVQKYLQRRPDCQPTVDPPVLLTRAQEGRNHKSRVVAVTG